MSVHALVFLDIYNVRWYFQPFSGCIHEIYDSVQRFVSLILSVCSPAPRFSLHLQPAFSTARPPPPSSAPTRVYFVFSPQYFFAPLREIALFPTILSPISVIIEFALRLGYRARSRGRRRRAIVDVSHLKLRGEECIKDKKTAAGTRQVAAYCAFRHCGNPIRRICGTQGGLRKATLWFWKLNLLIEREQRKLHVRFA